MPMDLPKFRTPDSTTKLVPIVSTARAAKILIKRWMDRYNYMPDAFVVEGPKSGGHQGVKMEDLQAAHAQLDVELRNVVELVKEYAHIKKIPVIAAGGVDDGADMYKFIAMGASGVQVGSRFVATYECDATESFKIPYTQMKGPEDIVVIKSPVGLPLRVINNSFVKSLGDGSKKPKSCPFKCLITCEPEKVDFCISSALMVAHRGNTDSGVMCCGADGWKIKKIVHVDELIANFAKDYDAAEAKALA
jgi:nitronate monooxygenase